MPARAAGETTAPGPPALLRVARIGRAHGLRGEVRLDVRTDDPRGRLTPGTRLATDPASAGPLTVRRLRSDGGSWFAFFAEVADRGAAEALSGVDLLAPPTGVEEDAWYPHELAGLRAELADGSALGAVEGVEHFPAQDLLVVRHPSGARVLVPFVRALVPVVDVAGGRVVLEPPGGLFPGLGEADDDGAPGPAPDGAEGTG